MTAVAEKIPGTLSVAERRSAWRRSGLLFVLATALLFALYFETVAAMVEIWMVSDTYGYGFLILPLFLYLAFQRRRQLACVTPRPCIWALLWMAGALLVHLVGSIASILLLQQLAFVALWQGLFALLMGWPVVRQMLFPLFFLFFAVPAGAEIVPLLQTITADITVFLLRSSGIPTFLSGVLIEIPTGRFVVAEVCSGVRFLITSLVWGTLLTHLFFRYWPRRVLFMLLCLVVPILANGLRAYGIIMLAHLSDQRLAVSVDHVVYGLIFLSLVLFILTGLGALFRDRWPSEETSLPVTPSASTRLSSSLGAFFLAVLLLGAGKAWTREITAPPTAVGTVEWAALEPRDAWSLTGHSLAGWDPSFPGADTQLLRSYQGPDSEVALFVAHYLYQRDGHEVIANQNSFVGRGRENRITRFEKVEIDLANRRQAGLSQVLTAFHVGACCVLMNYLLPREVPRICAREGITGLTGVPPLWFQLINLDWPSTASQSLRYFANTGGHLPRPALMRLREIFPTAAPYLMYGLTEAFRSTYLDPEEVDRRPDSIGKAIPNAEILVVREDGRPAAPGEEGELVHRGPLVSLGYWNDPERTAERFRPAPNQVSGLPLTEVAVWSGDLVRRDDEGFLYFVGRRDDMIKTSGYRVSPTEIEEVVFASGLVAMLESSMGTSMTKKVFDMRDHHPALQGWRSTNGELLIGGIPVTRLALRVGATPFFAYDRARVETRVAELRAHLPGKLNLHYAIKANPMSALVSFLAPRVDGFDVASAGELTKALDAGMPAEKIGFAGPGKTDQELTQALAAGVLIQIESSGELARLETIASGMGVTPRIALRINPDFQLGGSGMRMGGGAQQFGIDAEDAPRLIRESQTRGLAIQGFHIFAGSQNLNAEIIADVQNKTAELALRLAGDLVDPLRYLNLGGGFGIPYFPKDQPLVLARVGENLADVVANLAKDQPDARLVLELGRYIVGEAGVYVTRIIDHKISRGEIFLVTDGGLHHNLAASGNFGQVIRRNYPVLIANKMSEELQERASVVGCLCTPLDLLADKVSLSQSEVGDLVAVFQSGAYGLTASPTAFLGHPAPVEVLV